MSLDSCLIPKVQLAKIKLPLHLCLARGHRVFWTPAVDVNNINHMCTCRTFSAVVLPARSFTYVFLVLPLNAVFQSPSAVKVFYQSPAVSSGSITLLNHVFFISPLFCFCFFYIYVFTTALQGSFFRRKILEHSQRFSVFSWSWWSLCLQSRQPRNKYSGSLLASQHICPTKALPLSKSHRCTIPQSHARAKRNEE